MNIILFTKTDLNSAGQLVLNDGRLRHIVEIHRSAAGDHVKVGELNGLMGTAVIESLDNRQAILSLNCVLNPPPKLPLTIVLALPRPKMLRRIFRSVAELGVGELILINTSKVEKSYWQSPALETRQIQRYLTEGLQQAQDTIMPSVDLQPRFKPFVEDLLPALCNGKRALVAHPASGVPCPHNLKEKVILAIGPEGGFTPYEFDKLQDTGFTPIHLGARILRVENAVTALTSKLFDQPEGPSKWP